MSPTLILDEQLDSEDLTVSRTLNVLGERFECTYRAVRNECPGIKDELLPDYCRANGIEVLVSANTKDFGAKRELFRRLLDAGVSVVAVKSKHSLTAERQVAILAIHMRSMATKLTNAASPILVTLTETTTKDETLESLTAVVVEQAKLRLKST